MRLLTSFIIVLALCPTLCRAENEVNVREGIRRQLTEFAACLSYLNDDEEGIDPDAMGGMYGGGAYFTFNGTESSLADFLKYYARKSLGGKTVDHTLNLTNSSIAKMSSHASDKRWTVKGSLLRSSTSDADLSYLPVDVLFVVRWNGMDHNVSILEVDFELEPKLQTATIEFTSAPNGAVVKIGNKYMGETPLTLDGQKPGSYTVTFSAEGYESQTKVINVKAGNTASCSAALVAKQVQQVAEQPQKPEIPATQNHDADSLVTVKGIVRDEDGAPLIGASVVVLGSRSGAVTNVDGEFTIRVPHESALKVMYIGYKPKIVPARAKVDITLKPDGELFNRR